MTAMPPHDNSAIIGFGQNPLDRESDRREDEAYIAAQRAKPGARFLAVAGDVPLLRRRGEAYDALFDAAAAASLGAERQSLYLGKDGEGAPLFAVSLDKAVAEALAGRGDVEAIDLRSIAVRGLVPPGLLGSLGGAKAMLDWHNRHGFCANCGAKSLAKCAGWRRDCPSCAAQHFPRVDPVVIMLAIDGERCLMGRQTRFPAGMYSALAGFLEPGETAEDAVRREIFEEAGVRCTKVTYFASQPWPFPSSLMIGCFAQAAGPELKLDQKELEDARWFTREEVSAMFAAQHPQGFVAPQPVAIAHHLLKAFLEKGRALLEG
jgi:NAD+ diphosphatase